MRCYPCVSQYFRHEAKNDCHLACLKQNHTTQGWEATWAPGDLVCEAQRALPQMSMHCSSARGAREKSAVSSRKNQTRRAFRRRQTSEAKALFPHAFGRIKVLFLPQSFCKITALSGSAFCFVFVTSQVYSPRFFLRELVFYFVHHCQSSSGVSRMTFTKLSAEPHQQ